MSNAAAAHLVSLSSAAQAAREAMAALAEARRIEAQLAGRRDELAQAEVAAEEARAEGVKEDRDVERLESPSLRRLAARVTGSLEERLAEEQAESRSAEARELSADRRVDDLKRAVGALERDLEPYADAPSQYQAALQAVQDELLSAGGPRGQELAELAASIDGLKVLRRELKDIMSAAKDATDRLAPAIETLRTAQVQAYADLFSTGPTGIVFGQFKNDSLDAFTAAAPELREALSRLGTAVADVEGFDLAVDRLTFNSSAKWMDVYLDSPFNDADVAEKTDELLARVEGMHADASAAGATAREQRKQAKADLVVFVDRRRTILEDVATTAPILPVGPRVRSHYGGSHGQTTDFNASGSKSTPVVGQPAPPAHGFASWRGSPRASGRLPQVGL